MMYVALTYDHRIVDGLEAVQFLVRVKEFIEDPGHLLDRELTPRRARGGARRMHGRVSGRRDALGHAGWSSLT